MLTPGKASSEFLLSLAAIGAFTVLIALDKIALTNAMMETVFQLAMVYVAGRAVPKTAQALQGIAGGGKELQGLAGQLAAALAEERARR